MRNNRRLAVLIATLGFLFAVPAAADYLSGQCVSCARCPPCGSGGYSSGGYSGGGTPIIKWLFGTQAREQSEPKKPKPKYPDSFREFDEVGEEARENLRKRLIRPYPRAKFGARAVSESLVVQSGTAFFSNPTGGDPRFAPNPGLLRVQVPVAKPTAVRITQDQLGYALGIARVANGITGVSIEDQRFLLDQLGLMLSGGPVQLDLAKIEAEPVDSDDLDLVEDVMKRRTTYDGERREIFNGIRKVIKNVAFPGMKRDQVLANHGLDTTSVVTVTDFAPDTAEFRKANDAVQEQSRLYERFLRKERELTQEYRDKVTDLLEKNPKIKLNFNTAIVPHHVILPQPMPSNK